MNDSWTWTMVWGLTVGVGDGLGGGGKRREHWDNCNRITIIKKEKKTHLQSHKISLFKMFFLVRKPQVIYAILSSATRFIIS